jgi:DNA polymerase III epsilon subunit-like protein
MESSRKEIYISVDVETAGPNPGTYSLLSIGACLVADPAQRFYVELQPVHEAAAGESLQVSGLSVDTLKSSGQPPIEAMRQFADWVERVAADGQPVFVAFNAPFDWMFVADYFHRFLGRNPFGHKALDMKAFFMGMRGIQWTETGFEEITHHYQLKAALPHHALEDALAQAELFRRMLEEQSKGTAAGS